MATNIILPFSELQAELNNEAMIDPNAIIEITENGRYDVARYGYADVNVESGSSDFSTAEVTVVFETEATLYVPYYEDDGFRGMDSVILDSGTYNVVLYKGVALTTVINGQMAGTGNIEIHENEGTITGDCTITIS